MRKWESGKKFGRLTLVKRAGTKNGRQLWSCDCECGTKNVVVRADKLSDGRKKSCGCLAAEINERYRPMRDRAEKGREEFRRLRFSKRVNLVKERIEERHTLVRDILLSNHVHKNDPLWRPKYYAELVFDDECYYCKGPLSSDRPSLDLKYGSHALYQAYNVVPSCTFCMQLRGLNSLTFEEMEILSPALELIQQRKETNESRNNS
jgi:hypothetical protein